MELSDEPWMGELIQFWKILSAKCSIGVANPSRPQSCAVWVECPRKGSCFIWSSMMTGHHRNITLCQSDFNTRTKLHTSTLFLFNILKRVMVKMISWCQTQRWWKAYPILHTSPFDISPLTHVGGIELRWSSREWSHSIYSPVKELRERQDPASKVAQ